MTAPLLRFARYREIAVDVAARLAAGDEQAIVASSGMGSAITVAALQGSSNGAVSLRMPTIESFARQVLNEAGDYPRIASELEQRLAMRSAARLVADRIIESQALGAMLQRSYRDVRDSGLTLDEFEPRMGSLRRRRRTETMLRAWREYERLIVQLGAVDPADILLRGTTIIEEGRGGLQPQIIAGFYDMTGAQLRLLHALAKAGRLSAIFVPTSENDPFATRFIAQLPDSVLSPQSSVLRTTPSSGIAQYENRFVEFREICRAVKARIDEGASPSSIAIVARSLSAHDIRLINRFASEFGFPTTATESKPLFAHRIGRSIRTLLTLRDRMIPRTDVLQVLRDGFQTSRQISIDALDDATRRANLAFGDSDSVRNVKNLDDYADVVAEIEPFAPAAALSGAAWNALLTRILERFQLETEEDVVAAEAIEEIAAIMLRSEAWRRRFDSGAIIDLLEQQSISAALPPAAASVWVGDIMRFRGRTFDHIFVARMEDEVFPQRRSDDPLLTDTDRRALQLREIGDGRDEERLLFQLLHDGAETSIQFTVAASDGVGKMIRPSSLLKQFATEKYPDRRADILRNFAKEFAKPAPVERRAATAGRQLQLVAKSGTRSEFDGYLAANPAIESRIRAALSSLSPTHLEDFGECPQKFLLKHILGVRDVSEPERELHVNPRDKGSLDHSILERFYRSLTPKEIDDATAALPQLAAPLRDRLHSIIDTAFDELDSTMPPFNRAMRDIERRSTKRHLRTFLAADFADLAEAGLRPSQFEYAFGAKFVRHGKADRAEPYIFQAKDIAITIEGKIDRIDAAPTRLRVIDYKSGKALRHHDLAGKIDRGVRMQLALYAMAVAEFFGIDAKAVTGAIKPLRGGNESKYTFALSDHTDRLRQTIEIFVAAMLGGTFPAFPSDNDNDFNSCKYCPVNHSCRPRHHDAESYAVTRHGDPRTLLGVVGHEADR